MLTEPETKEATAVEGYDAPERSEYESVHPYRSVSRSAVAALVLALLGLLAFNAPLLVFLPIIALALGLVATQTIVRYPEEYVGKIPAQIAVYGSILTIVCSLSMHTYIHFTEVPNGYERAAWRELQPEKGGQLPFGERAVELDGQKVFMEGYVYPNTETTNLRTFVMVRDKGICCFGGTPKPTDMIYVVLEGDLRVNYSWRERKLGGIFEINDDRHSVGKINQIGYFRLTADYLK